MGDLTAEQKTLARQFVALVEQRIETELREEPIEMVALDPRRTYYTPQNSGEPIVAENLDPAEGSPYSRYYVVS